MNIGGGRPRRPQIEFGKRRDEAIGNFRAGIKRLPAQNRQQRSLEEPTKHETKEEQRINVAYIVDQRIRTA